MKSNSLKENMVLQTLYQILILGIPLILSPYLTRTLGAEKLGIYTYTHSISYYFVIFAMLGINRHGQRSIAQSRDNSRILRSTFWSLNIVHIIFSITAILAYVLFVAIFVSDNIDIYLLQGVYVASALIDYTWLFIGLESFKSIVIKNTIIKICELALIFLFVKKPDDLYIYTAIMVSSVFIGHVVLMPQIFRTLKPVAVTWSECTGHIKPLLVLSISVVAVSLYTVFDKTLLGLMMDMEEVSFYELANKIVGVPKTILGVMTTVLFPRVCRIVEGGSDRELKKVFDVSWLLMSMLGFGATAILIGVAKVFAPLYFGEPFGVCGDIMICMSPVILIVSLGDLVRTQLMISKHRDKQFIFCVVLNAIVNIVLSLIMIPRIGIYGAVVGSVAAELCGLIVECWICRKEISIIMNMLEISPFLIAGVLSVLVMSTLNKPPYTWGSLLIQATGGAAVYSILAIVYIFVLNKSKKASVVTDK